ncbi:DUF1127 domain-containing protein [Citrobacter sp. JGM124]|nr:DUF1127 domain-containing protein [Citrobacter sp. JGM124]
MEFHENQARKPFSGLVMLYHYFRRKAVNRQTVRRLRELSPEQLRDIGLSKHDISHWE